MFKRAGSNPRDSTHGSDRSIDSTHHRPISVTTVNVPNGQSSQVPPPTTPRVRRSVRSFFLLT